MLFFKKDKRGASLKKLSRAEKELRIRELRERGAKAVEKGKPDKALSSYRELILLEPKDADYRRKLADCYQKLGQKKEELDARCHAATLYSEAGFPLKGIAMCKMALLLDPEHQATQKKLAELNALSGVRPVFGRAALGLPVAKKVEAAEKSDEIQAGQPAVEEKASKSAVLKAAQARVAAVLETRVRAASARMAAKAAAASVAVETEKLREKAPSVPPMEGVIPSRQRGAPLESVPLTSILPPLFNVGPVSLEQDLLESLPASVPYDEEVFIVDLDMVLPADGKEASDEAVSEAGAKVDVASILQRTPLLSDLSEAGFIHLVENIQFRELCEGEVLFRQGAAADAMYAVVEGQVVATLEGPPMIELAHLGEGEFFGEIGLLAKQPRQATITATCATQVLCFDPELMSAMEELEPEFIRILLRFVRERLVASLIATNPLFAPFAGGEAEDLTRRFQFLEVRAHKALVRQGQGSEGVFILLTGGARVTKSEEGKPSELSLLGPGDIFGEMSLLNGEQAIASVVTTAKSFVLRLPAKDFTQLIMMHPAVLDYISSLASERERKNSLALPSELLLAEDRISLL